MEDAEIESILIRTGNLQLAVLWHTAIESRKMRDWPLVMQGAVKKLRKEALK